jgi:hypothetical protein
VLNLLEKLQAGTAELPPGCEVTYELEVVDIFRSLLSRSDSAVELLQRRYQDFRDTLGVRPTAAELFREGYNPRAMRVPFGSWLGFVKAQGGLTVQEDVALEEANGFFASLETTEMSKSYKMLVLLALLNRDQFPGKLSLELLVEEVGAAASRDIRIAADLGEAAGDSVKLKRLLTENPIQAWVGGRGTDGVSYFALEGDVFRTRVDLSASAAPAAQELLRELIEWRLAEYFQRSGRPTSDIAVKLSHSGGRPILMPLPREAHPELPEGWADLRVDQETFQANFAKVAVNVVRRPGSDENVLPELLRQWFGADAGLPGTRHQVLLSRDGDAWGLKPLGSSRVGAVPYKAYRRIEIPPLFGLQYQRNWEQGFVRQGDDTFLFVTLDKAGQAENFQYKDHFLAADEFQWQSQNRTTQRSEHGESIKSHRSREITVHLFIRANSKTPDGRGAPFYYCGPVEFVSWSGEKPITVIWKLSDAVPYALWNELAVPRTE